MAYQNGVQWERHPAISHSTLLLCSKHYCCCVLRCCCTQIEFSTTKPKKINDNNNKKYIFNSIVVGCSSYWQEYLVYTFSCLVWFRSIARHAKSVPFRSLRQEHPGRTSTLSGKQRKVSSMVEISSIHYSILKDHYCRHRKNQ